MKALCTSTDKNRASIPFDKERSGFVMGEGSGILVLEELEHAKKEMLKYMQKLLDLVQLQMLTIHLNDLTETMAIKTALGTASKTVMISSTKGNIGHLLGAAGAVEAILSVKAMENELVPPTINYKEKDEECDLDIVPNEPRKAKLNIVMSNSLGFGGHNSSIILKKWEEE